MNPRNPQLIVIALGALCVLVASADFIYVKHPHVRYEAWFNFYGFAAFAASCLAVGACYLLRPVISRDEDYYDE